MTILTRKRLALELGLGHTLNVCTHSRALYVDDAGVIRAYELERSPAIATGTGRRLGGITTSLDGPVLVLDVLLTERLSVEESIVPSSTACLFGGSEGSLGNRLRATCNEGKSEGKKRNHVVYSRNGFCFF